MRLGISKSKNTINYYIIKDYTIIIKKNNNKIIPKDTRTSFNVGYLFLQKLYNQLKINDICKSIQDKYQFHFDLNEILS